MAAKRRHWKEKGGRFWARVAVPESLQEQFGKSELLEPLGGDLRVADRNHPAAVARLRQKIDAALATLSSDPAKVRPSPISRPICEADRLQASWSHYTDLLSSDDDRRSNYPTGEQIEAEYDRVMPKIDAGTDFFGMINSYTDLELMVRAREDDANFRTRRLAALKSSFASGDDRRIGPAVNSFLRKTGLQASPGSPEWRDLANGLMRAEIEALQRTIERVTGDCGGQPRNFSTLKRPLEWLAVV